MARSRILKHGFFLNEVLAELPPFGRLLFAGLWILADREGRLEDRPRRIKASLFPWDEVDVEALLTALESKRFIDRYTVGEMPLIQVAKFAEHQTPHVREAASILPGPISKLLDISIARALPGKGSAEASPRSPLSVSVSGSTSVSVDSLALQDSQPPPVLTFPTDGKPDSWPLVQEQVTEWQGLYPSLDIAGQCRGALAWIRADPGHRKTARGMKQFLVNWFNRTIKEGGNRRAAAAAPVRVARNYDWLDECRHQPKCGSLSIHQTQLTLDEGRRQKARTS